MLLALGGASLADICTQIAEILVECGAAGHEARAKRADIGAITAEANASLHTVVRNARVGAVLAGNAAGQTGVDTGTQFGRHVVVLIERWHGEMS
ncbi:hypothetical protein BH23BAC4_BH23BAC4_06110 [soil metagenome]